MNLMHNRLLAVIVLAVLARPLVAPAAGVSRGTYSALESARVQIENGAARKAIISLQQLLGNNDISAYDRAISYQLLAHAQVEVDDRTAAINSLEQALSLAELPETIRHPMLYNLGQLYLAQAQYGKAAAQLEAWLQAESLPPASAWALLGAAYVQSGNYTQAIEALNKALAGSNEPEENWYQNLLGAHYEMKHYNECASLLQTMIRRYPARSSYWKQLVGIHLLRKRPQDALVAQELAWLQKLLGSEQELLQLAMLYQQNGEPYKAGMLLETELQAGRIRRTGGNYAILATAWQQAQETARSIEALQAAIRLADNADLRLRLARLYLGQESWQPAANTLDELLASGTLDKRQHGTAWLLLGIARHEAGEDGQSAAAFRRASQYQEVHETAQQWLAYLESTGMSPDKPGSAG